MSAFGVLRKRRVVQSCPPRYSLTLPRTSVELSEMSAIWEIKGFLRGDLSGYNLFVVARVAKGIGSHAREGC